MKKSLIFLLALAATTALMASSENNAVRFTQDGQSSKWYYVASTPTVIFSDEGISVNNGQSYNFADGIITSVFFSAPEVGDEINYLYDVTSYYINYIVTSVGESNTVRVKSGHKSYLPAELEIPATVEYKDMTFDVTELSSNAFAENTYLQSVVIPNSVTTIGAVAFAQCTNLKTVSIPASVTTFSNNGCAFYKCFALTDVTVAWTENIPAIQASDFGELTLSNITLHVPFGTKALYEAAPVWQDFFIDDPADEWFTVRTDGVAGSWNTICLEKNITAIDGATFWTVSGQTETDFIIDQITEPQAGQGYLIRFTATELKVQYGDQEAASPVEATAANPMQGTYTQINFDGEGQNELVGNYVVYNNQLCPVVSHVGMYAYRAYLVAALVPNGEPAHAPVRARLSMPKSKQTPTELEQSAISNQPSAIKMIKDGRLVIIRGGKTYNALGM